MRTTILTGMMAIALLATSPVAAQTGPPQVIETVTGPSYIATGGVATLDVSVDVVGAEADLYITWVVAENGESCCDLVSSSVVSGRANAQPAQYGSQRWTVFGPHVDIRVTLALRDTITSGQIIVGGYLPGTNVSQYLTVNGWKMIVGAPLPGAGGPLGGTHSSAPYLVGGGLVMLVLAAVCFAGLTERVTWPSSSVRKTDGGGRPEAGVVARSWFDFAALRSPRTGGGNRLFRGDVPKG